MERVTLSHYTLNGGEGGAVPGVERVMLTQKDMLKQRGYRVELIVGSTDFPPAHEIHVVPDIRSGAHALWTDGSTSVSAPVLADIIRSLTLLTRDDAAIFHNTLNAGRHNPPLGIAAAKIVDRRVQDGDTAAVLWVHDARGVEPHQLHRLLPTVGRAKLAIVSSTRKTQLIAAFDAMREQGLSVPDYDIRVIPNPIDHAFNQSDVPVPDSLVALAPNVYRFTQEHAIAQSLSTAEEILLGNVESLCVVLPGRIVGQKGIQKALRVLEVYAKMYQQRSALVVTGPPDTRKAENVHYLNKIRHVVQSSSVNPLVDVVFLGGVDWRYMPWLYRRADVLFAPFQNEGFGLPPIEAACCGLPSVISADPALMESTAGHALIVALEDWENNPASVAKGLHEYLSSNLPARHVNMLARMAASAYAPEVIQERLEDLLELGRHVNTSSQIHRVEVGER